MPLNIPTVTTNDISFGPGRLYLGASGATPTVDVGAIKEEGITFEMTAERREIRQGNPKLIEYAFTQVQDAMVKVGSIEWDVTNLAYALGAGTTASSASQDIVDWGGDPLVTNVALHIEHQMPVTGQTLNIYAWKAFSEAGFPIQFGHDEHGFDYSWKLMRSGTNWAGATLSYKHQLFRILRQKT